MIPLIIHRNKKYKNQMQEASFINIKSLTMSKLLNTELFSLLTENSSVTNEQMHNAYEKFAKQIEKLNQPDEDYQTIYRRLNLTRIEFVSLQSLSQYEQGKKCA